MRSSRGFGPALWFLFILLLVGFFVDGIGAEESFVLIVNEQNPSVSLTRAEASRIFLKKKTHWGNGVDALPVDLTEDSPIREAFSRSVHGRTVAAVRTFWRRSVFAGRNIPTVMVDSEADVMAWVRSHPGGIGYLSSGTELGEGVRVLTLDEDRELRRVDEEPSGDLRRR